MEGLQSHIFVKKIRTNFLTQYPKLYIVSDANLFFLRCICAFYFCLLKSLLFIIRQVHVNSATNDTSKTLIYDDDDYYFFLYNPVFCLCLFYSAVTIFYI